MPYPNKKKNDTYFGGLFWKINLGQYESRFTDLYFEAIDDTNAVKITLFYFTDQVLNERKEQYQINLSLLKEVDDIDHFQSYPWGCILWETIYDSLQNAINGKAEKLKKSYQEKPKHKVEKYNAFCFMSMVQVC